METEYDRLIESNRSVIDICSTWINPGKSEIFGSRIRAIRWSVLIAMTQFNRVREAANKIYHKMRILGFFCPHVQTNNEFLQLRWVEEKEKIITIRIYHRGDQFSITYGIGKSSRTIFTPSRTDDFVAALEILTDELASYEHGSGPVKRSRRSKI